jgi:hypothetical protein
MINTTNLSAGAGEAHPRNMAAKLEQKSSQHLDHVRRLPCLAGPQPLLVQELADPVVSRFSPKPPLRVR